MAASSETKEDKKTEKVYTILEFYSGIGGMHYAAKGCGFMTNVVAAFEINTTANTVYKHNFPETHLRQSNIEGLTTKELDKLAADIFLMSPPCQPFTRVGLQGASSDPRSKSFLHIMDLLAKLSNPPDYILMENVKGFELSDTREQFINTLKEAGYTYQEFLLSPNQFGIPNSRLRYYMLAKRKPHQFYFYTRQEQVLDHIPPPTDELKDNCCHTDSLSFNSTRNTRDLNLCNEKNYFHVGENNSEKLNVGNHTHQYLETQQTSTTITDCPPKIPGQHDQTNGMGSRDNCRCHKQTSCENNAAKIHQPLSEFLEFEKNEEYFSQFLLPEKVLSRFALLLDIVTLDSTHSCCFTKAYGHYTEGTGSVLKITRIDDTSIFNEYRALGPDASDSKRAAILSDLKLRYFTPREVANIMKFPKTFGFPCGTSVKQQYRLLGNSLNVLVVTELLKCLLNG